MQYFLENQSYASTGLALMHIVEWLNDGNVAAPGTGPAFTVEQVYDPNAITPWETPVAGLLSNLAVDNCWNPAANTAIPDGALVVLNSSGVSHPFQLGIQKTSGTNYRFVVGNDKNKAGALGGWDTTVQNTDITNAASWRDGKSNTIDFGITSTPQAKFNLAAEEDAFFIEYHDNQTPQMRAWEVGKMTDTCTGDNYPVVWRTECSKVWANETDGWNNGGEWNRFSNVDESTIVGMVCQNKDRWSNGVIMGDFGFKDTKTGEWYLGAIELCCQTIGHKGQFGTLPLVKLSGGGLVPGYGVENMKKAGVDYGYMCFKNYSNSGVMTLVVAGDSATDITA